MRSLFLSFSVFISLISCQKENLPESESGNNVAQVTESLTNSQGLFITEFREEGKDKTSWFLTYMFTFKTDGTVTAVSPQNTVTGTYLIFTDDGRTELKMTFPTVDKFDELTDDWYLVFHDDITIRWQDGDDILQFGNTQQNTGNPDDSISEDISSVISFLSNTGGLLIYEFIEDRENKTPYFRNYSFIFNGNGNVQAFGPNSQVNGTYRVWKDDGRIELAMSFPNLGEFDELRDDWYFISKDENFITFSDGEDVLKFKKL